MTTRRDEAGVQQLKAEASDVFLGRLDDSSVEVHERVRAHVDLPGSRPLVWLDRHSTAPSVSAALDRMRRAP
jgi:hypothetical protein